METLQLFASYLIHLAPGMALLGALFALLPRSQKGLRIATLLLLFILLRDGMTREGFWAVGGAAPIAFTGRTGLLWALGLAAAALVPAIRAADRALTAPVVWWRGHPALGIASALAGALILAAPTLLIWGSRPSLMATPPSWLTGLAAIACGGNLLEEYLFRGLLQSHLEPRLGPPRAAATSAVAFAACHVFLALNLTTAGWPLLAFTLAEGMVCALIRLRHGLAPAVVAHGTLIFLIARPL